MAGYFVEMHRDLPLYYLQNSSLFLTITNFTNQLGIFMIISHGKGAMYFSRLCFLVLEFFAYHIVIMQEWTKFGIIPE